MSQPDPGNLSHAVAVALLMALGGSYDLPPDATEPDALTGRDGALHALRLDRLPSGRLRVSVTPRPDLPEAGVTYQ